MKQLSTYNAFKKVKKNIKKHFPPEDVGELSRILSNRQWKNTFQLMDLLSRPQPEVPNDELDFTTELNETLDFIYAGPLAVNQNDIEANELARLLSGIHLKAFAEAYTEVATRRYHIPDFPDSAMFAMSAAGTYGTLPSLMASRGSIMPPQGLAGAGSVNAYDEVRQPVIDSTGVIAHGGEVKMNEATLTGGGRGPALPPVEGTMKIIGFEKNLGEDLGITVVQHQYMSAHYGLVKELVVKRILKASNIEQQGLLHEGDVIREANGVAVDTPQMLQRVLRNAVGEVTLKIITGNRSKTTASQLFLRAYFSYNPNIDNLIPCKEAGLPFKSGDVLQVLKQDDPYWWQARHYRHQQRAGLIPSIVLQERRRAFVQSASNSADLSYKTLAFGLARRRKKEVVVSFSSRDAQKFENKDLVLYEEVALISGFQRPIVCLIGADGVGRRSLRDMILRTQPQQYAVPIRHTTKPPDPDEDDETEFQLETHENMERADFENRFIEFGHCEGHYYGTMFDSVRQIVQSGRTCLFDCSVHAVLRIRNSEFMPYVIFLAAPSVSCMKAMYEYGMSMGFTHKWKRDEHFRHTLEYSMNIEQNYRHLIDSIVLCDNIETNFERLTEILNTLLVEHQWVPARWLY